MLVENYKLENLVKEIGDFKDAKGVSAKDVFTIAFIQKKSQEAIQAYIQTKNEITKKYREQYIARKSEGADDQEISNELNGKIISEVESISMVQVEVAIPETVTLSYKSSLESPYSIGLIKAFMDVYPIGDGEVVSFQLVSSD